MNTTVVAPSVLPVPLARTRSHIGHRLMWLIAATSCVLMLAVNLTRREGYTGDEGFYGVTARNMLERADYVLRPSYFPAGDFATDRDGFAHPPFNSYFYALALGAARGSVAGPEVLNVLAFGALLFLVYRIAARFDPRAGQFSVLLLAASAPMAGYFSMLEAEPLMTLFGLAAVECALRVRWEARGARAHGGAGRRGHRSSFGWLFLSGLALGMSFALKLWLCGPLVLAVLAALALRARAARLQPGAVIAGGLWFVAGGLLPAGAHLAAIAAFHPEDLGFWLRNIYFGIFTHAGISGSKLAGDATPAEWVHPIWYYAAALYRDHFFLVPAVVFGLRPALRDRRFRGGLLLVCLAGAAGVVPLSLLKVKEPLYVLSCAAFLYLLAGACLAALVRRFDSQRGLDRTTWWTGLAIAVALLVAFPVAQARGIQPDKITPTFVLTHTVVWLIFLGAVLWAHQRRTAMDFVWTVYGACAVAVVATFAWNAVAHVPRDATIARVARPYLDREPPGALAMIASNFKGYQYLTFHRGMYWHELPAGAVPDELLRQPEFASVRAFILSPEEQQQPQRQPWLKWLETHAVDRTDELDRELGRVSGYRVFVRPATSATGGPGLNSAGPSAL